MKSINIKFIDHNRHRYPTCGDYWETRVSIEFRISKMLDWRFEALVLIHELTEYVICRFMGITIQQIDRFDIAFEKCRKPGNVDEPGDDRRAPYRIPHGIATGVERIVAAIIGVHWNEYASTIEAL